jgi:hypothetical protein
LAVFLGAAAAFMIQSVVAVACGSFLRGACHFCDRYKYSQRLKQGW